MEIPVEGKTYKISAFGKFINIFQLISFVVFLFVINNIYSFIKNVSEANFGIIIIIIMILFSIFLAFFVYPWEIITDAEGLYVKPLIWFGRKIKWVNIKKFVRNFLRLTSNKKRSVLIVTRNEVILEKFLILPNYFENFEELLDVIEKKVMQNNPINEEKDFFELYSTGNRIVSTILSIFIIGIVWFFSIFLFIGLIFYPNPTVLLATLIFVAFAVLITIATINSLVGSFYEVNIDKNAFSLIVKKPLNKIFKKRIFDYSSFDFFLYCITDNSNRSCYRRFFIKDKKGKIYFKLYHDIDLYHKMFEKLKEDNKALVLISKPKNSGNKILDFIRDNF